MSEPRTLYPRVQRRLSTPPPKEDSETLTGQDKHMTLHRRPPYFRKILNNTGYGVTSLKRSLPFIQYICPDIKAQQTLSTLMYS